MATPPITTLRIQGFKSLVDVQLQPRQLNIFIGKPNVGKSNILEALSLLGAGYGANNARRFMEGFIRFEKPQQLFADNQPERGLEVSTDEWSVWLGKIPSINGEDIGLAIGPKAFVSHARQHLLAGHETDNTVNSEQTHYTYSGVQSSIMKGTLRRGDTNFRSFGNSVVESLVRRYSFGAAAGTGLSFSYLKPPGGDNLFDVVNSSPRLQAAIAGLFEQSGLQFVLRSDDSTFEVQKLIRYVSYSYPYSSIADTFQRLIFYLAAIESNTGAVLLFEEPEAHSFPTYISQLAERIAEDVRAARNQYFITTHSPYLLDQLIESTSADQVAVFIVGYADYQTTITQVPDDQLGHLLDLSSDVFFNLNRLPLTDADVV